MKRKCFTLVVPVLFALSCSDPVVQPDEERFEIIELAPLEAIPYDVLGQGTLAFERITGEEETGGVYIVDVNQGLSYGVGGIVLQEPALSPDGTQFVFTHPAPFHPDRIDESSWDVYVAERQWKEIRSVSSLAGRELTPAWLADGEQIAFVERTDDSYTHVYRQSPTADAGDRQLVRSFPPNTCTSLGIDQISISQDDVAIFSHTLCDGIREIATLDLNSGALLTVFSDTARADGEIHWFTSPKWSPDGRHVAYMELVLQRATLEPVRTNLKVMNSDGSGNETIASIAAAGGQRWCCGGEQSLAWSPDGTKIAFNHEEGELVAHIYVVGRNGTGLTKVTSADNADDRNLSWVR